LWGRGRGELREEEKERGEEGEEEKRRKKKEERVSRDFHNWGTDCHIAVMFLG